MLKPKIPLTTLLCLLAGALPGAAATLYVAPNGNDASRTPSKLQTPLRTIAKAAALARAGDTVVVRAGTYRETVIPATSGAPGKPIVFTPYRKETVILSGAEPVRGWTRVGEGIYRAAMPWSYSEDFGSDQVFADGRMLDLLRWPANTGTLTRPTNAKVVSAADAGDGKITFTVEPDFSEPDGRWDGAPVWVNLSHNGSDGQGQTGKVVGTDRAKGAITVSGIDNRTFQNGGYKPDQPWGVGPGTELYLFHPTKNGLEKTGGPASALAPGQWWRDAGSGTLYARLSDGRDPGQHRLEAKRRTYAFDLTDRSYVTIRGFRLFAAGITTDREAARRSNSVAAAHDIVLDRMQGYYLSHFTDQAGQYQMQWLQKCGIILSGTGNVLSNSTFRYSAGPCVSVIGQRNRVLGNVIRDANYNVTEAGCLDTGRSYDPARTTSFDHEIAYNTISDSPEQGINLRGLMNSDATRPGLARVHHNTIHDVMLRAYDSAALDQFGTDGQYVRIDHNLIYNLPGILQIGIYLDFGKRYVIDHNVIYNVNRPIQVNWNDPTQTNGTLVLNNTCLTADATPGQVAILNGVFGPIPGLVCRNNISSNGVEFRDGATVDHNLKAEDGLFVDAAKHDYRLRSDAAGAIGQGISVPPYDEGEPVDVGALPHGKPAFTAGARR